MPRKQKSTTTRRFERALEHPQENRFVLRLYVTGATPASQRAIENTKKLCEQHLPGRYELEVVDIYRQPELAQGVQIVAAPTLVKSMPPPLRKFIGDMSKTERLLLSLGVQPPK
jgi:circadian clock protein KaiB